MLGVYLTCEAMPLYPEQCLRSNAVSCLESAQIVKRTALNREIVKRTALNPPIHIIHTTTRAYIT